MNHTFFTGCKFKECTEFFDADYLTLEYLTFFKFSCDDLDHLSCLIHHSLICTTDAYKAIICNVNLNTCLINDCVDSLTSLTNNVTNLLRLNLHLDDLRSILSYFFSRLSDSRLHAVIHDVESCIMTSCDCTFYDRSGQTMNLDIHLDCCDTFCCTCYLKVHIAEEIFKTLDICQ